MTRITDIAIAEINIRRRRGHRGERDAGGEQVAKALVNKGVTLGALGRGEEAIAAYDDLLARFAAATELPLRELEAKARSSRDRLRKA